jgi:hypothetical protein
MYELQEIYNNKNFLSGWVSFMRSKNKK